MGTYASNAAGSVASIVSLAPQDRKAYLFDFCFGEHDKPFSQLNSLFGFHVDFNPTHRQLGSRYCHPLGKNEIPGSAVTRFGFEHLKFHGRIMSRGTIPNSPTLPIFCLKRQISKLRTNPKSD